ncbi:beta-glucosidase [Bacillus sp. J14TS2]|uniref:beta-glucosidase BglX n=1 Tax=Bacillus sp. J14TS2 TaxID=2807188 RepID=UPI001B141350|nr:beta-glucosidase BglX [Bacillus sp. J14TS2]GIN74305.1 beta-glucosidase [Bacillus sp. J14TS2]
MEKNGLLALIDSLSVEEKIGQLVQLTGDFFANGTETTVTGPIKKLGLHEEYNIYHTGSILNITSADEIIKIQDKYLKNSSHKIPLLFMADIIYGFRTIFPIPLAQACSWNFPLIEEAASVSAKECYEEGVHVTFAPMVDIVRDPRWGRVMESPGEDLLIAELYAQSVVEGLQGSSEQTTIPEDKIAGCVKHFAAYGAPVAGREYNAVDMSEHMLREVYLPSYLAAVKAKVKLVMTAFNTLNGIPSTGNEWLNTKILRDEFGFAGVLISDYAAVEELITHGYANGAQEAAQLALKATVDIDMKTSVFANELAAAVQSNEQMMTLLNEAVYRIVNLKNELGLFEDPYRGLKNKSAGSSSILSKEHKETALRLTEESIVLLKNDGILPIEKDKKAAIIGPYHDETSTLGMWAIKGDVKDTITLKEGIDKISKNDHNQFCRGSHLLEKGSTKSLGKFEEQIPNELSSQDELIAEAVKVAENADVVILALGESIYQSGEGGSRTDLTLPRPQQELFEAISVLEKPLITIIYSGRPLILTDVEKHSNALIQAWFPGTMGGEALANILYGVTNPSGKLSMSFPRSMGQIPVFYSELSTGRPDLAENGYYRFASRYIDESNKPLYPFGYGISYTNFKYKNLSLNKKQMNKHDELVVTVEVENIGNYDGEEIVQLYLRDHFGSTARPVKILKDFKKVSIEKGETTTISFTIVEEQLKIYRSDLSYASEIGQFDVFIGSSSEDLPLKATFELVGE